MADVPAAIGFALVLGGLVAAPVRAGVLTGAPARALGTLSYGIYLLHYLAILALRSQDAWPEDLGAAMAAVLALTVPAAALSWFGLERPVLRWARRRTAGPRRRAPRPVGAARRAASGAAPAEAGATAVAVADG